MPNCSANYTSIEPDPDISGPGVLLSFVVTAGLTFSVSMLGRILPLLPEPSFGKSPRSLARSFTMSGDRKDFWKVIIERLLRGLADQQLMAGLVILIVGFSKWDITVYHFSIVCDLAWLSSSTHFSTMFVLRDYFCTYRGARLWRVAIMILMYVGLMISLVLEFNDYWNYNLASPARCLFGTGHITRPKRVLSLVFFSMQTTLGYLSTIMSLFKNSPECSPHTFERQSIVSQGAPKQANFSSHIQSFLFNPLLLLSLSILFNTTWFALGLISLYADLTRGYSLINPQSYNQIYTWGFGQLVPMLLITIPLLTALEIFFEESASFKARREELRLDRLVKGVMTGREDKIEWQVLEGVAIGDGVKEGSGSISAVLSRGESTPVIPDLMAEKGLAFPPAAFEETAVVASHPANSTV